MNFAKLDLDQNLDHFFCQQYALDFSILSENINIFHQKDMDFFRTLCNLAWRTWETQCDFLLALQDSFRLWSNSSCKNVCEAAEPSSPRSHLHQNKEERTYKLQRQQQQGFKMSKKNTKTNKWLFPSILQWTDLSGVKRWRRWNFKFDLRWWDRDWL